MRTDAYLVEAAKRGDGRSRERLVLRTLPIVRSIAAGFRDFGLPLEDLVQEGSLGLLEAIDLYEPGRGADFGAYARIEIRRAIGDAAVRLPTSNDVAAVADGATPDPEGAVVAREEVRAIDHAVDTLPDRQRIVVQRHFGFGREPQEIAEVAASLHVSQQRVRTIERDAFYALHDELEPIISPDSPHRPPRRGAREYR
jgi:RNA polymerase sigma factor (sigma-70 family)